MKFHLALLVTAVITSFNQFAIGAELESGCFAKEARIAEQIADATSRGQKHRLDGLQKALRATRANCTEQSLKDERETRIRKAKQELAEREKDLMKAEKSGDVDKLKKRRAKADEARRELVDAERP